MGPRVFSEKQPWHYHAKMVSHLTRKQLSYMCLKTAVVLKEKVYHSVQEDLLNIKADFSIEEFLVDVEKCLENPTKSRKDTLKAAITRLDEIDSTLDIWGLDNLAGIESSLTRCYIAILGDVARISTKTKLAFRFFRCFVCCVRCGMSYDYLSDLYNVILGKDAFPPEWKTSDAKKVASAIIKSKDFSGMPILADALEDAGCRDSEILSHLRVDRNLWTPADWVLVSLEV